MGLSRSSGHWAWEVLRTVGASKGLGARQCRRTDKLAGSGRSVGRLSQERGNHGHPPSCYQASQPIPLPNLPLHQNLAGQEVNFHITSQPGLKCLCFHAAFLTLLPSMLASMYVHYPDGLRQWPLCRTG